MPVMQHFICGDCGNAWEEKRDAPMPARCPRCGGVDNRVVARVKEVKTTDARKGRRWIR